MPTETLRRTRRALVAATLAALLTVTGTGPAFASWSDDHGDDDGRGLAMVADFLIARPLGLAVTVTGTVIYALAFPFAAMSGDMKTPAERLIADPARFTFQRPLGDF